MPFRSERLFIARAAITVGLLDSGAMLAASSESSDGHRVFMHSGCVSRPARLWRGRAWIPRRQALAAQDYVVDRILLGGGIMPAFDKKLSDQELAAVATYIRTSWGNKFGPVDPEQIAKAHNTLTNSKVGPVSGA